MAYAAMLPPHAGCRTASPAGSPRWTRGGSPPGDALGRLHEYRRVQGPLRRTTTRCPRRAPPWTPRASSRRRPSARAASPRSRACRSLGYDRVDQRAVPAPCRLAPAVPVRRDAAPRQRPRSTTSTPTRPSGSSGSSATTSCARAMAFALSEILVISNIAPNLNPWAMSAYMDMLNRNAFGNYRTLLEDVTLHPAMGYYLNMLRQREGGPGQGPAAQRELRARGAAALLDRAGAAQPSTARPSSARDGKPVPTYDEEVVKGFAKVFTGWSFAGNNTATQLRLEQPEGELGRADGRVAGAPLDGGQAPARRRRAARQPDAAEGPGRRAGQHLLAPERRPVHLPAADPAPRHLATPRRRPGRSAAPTTFTNNGVGVRGDLAYAVTRDPARPGGARPRRRPASHASASSASR